MRPLRPGPRPADSAAVSAEAHPTPPHVPTLFWPVSTATRHRQVRSPLMLMHHLLSILVWPYAVLRGRALLLVLFFIITEVRVRVRVWGQG